MGERLVEKKVLETTAPKLTLRRFFVIAGQGLLVVLLAFALYLLVSVLAARHRTVAMVSAILSSDKIKIKSSELSPWQRQSLIKVEDPAFYHHRGVDLSTPGAGLTTISQSVAKKLYFFDFKPGLAKIRQTLLARYALNPQVSKEDQLTLFINLMWFHQGVVGLAEAAEFYYQKKVLALSQDEYLSLIAMFIAPKNFDVKERPQSNAERVRRIKLLLAGKYKPKGLMDLYYGTLTEDEQQGLAPASYFPPGD